MAAIVTRLRRGTPYTNKVTLMGKVLGKPRIQQDTFGEVTAIYLHIPEYEPIESNEPDYMAETYPQFPTNTYSAAAHTAGRRDATVPVLVRGQIARWCAAHIQTGMIVLVDARLHSLGATSSDACLTHIEAEHLQLIGEPHLPVMQMFPTAPPHFGAALAAHQCSIRTN